jgi:hypothetical protein
MLGELPEGEANKRLWNMVDAIAKARFFVAEEAYQAFLAVTFPSFRAERQIPNNIKAWWSSKGPEARQEIEELRFAPPEERREKLGSIQFQYWVEKEFTSWRERKDERRSAAEKLYLEVVEEDVPEWEIAAAARLGDMYQQFMNALYDAPLDPSIKGDQELVDIYRDALDQAAEPYRKSATTAFQHCIEEATRNTWFNQWSASCEVQLNKLDPRSYPLSDELRAQPAYSYSPLAIPRPIKRLQTQAEREAEEARSAAGQQE